MSREAMQLALHTLEGWAEKEAFEAVVAWAEAKLKDKNHG